MQKKRLLVASLLLSSGALHADISVRKFYYQIRLPESSRGCEQSAAELGQRFTAITGITAVEPVCKGVVQFSEGTTQYNLYSVALSYQAAHSAPSYSALLEGVFTDYATCLSKLDDHSRLYESITGYPVLAATCQEGPIPFIRSYVLRIDGYSAKAQPVAPRSQLFSFTSRFRFEDEALHQQTDLLLTRLGGRVVLRNKNTVYYYSPSSLPVYYEPLGIFPVGDECDAQLGAVRDLFSRLGSKSIIAHCTRNPNKMFNNDTALEVIRDLAPSHYGYLLKTLQYYSFAECMGDRARAMDEARSSKHNPVGALCRKFWDGRYEMMMFLGL